MSIRKHQPPPALPWTTQKPPNRRPHLPILRPKVDRPFRVIAIGSTCYGLDVHYNDGATDPCIGEENGCPCGVTKQAKRRQWFLLVALPPTMKLHILAITNGAYDGCPALELGAGDLRGRWLKVWRSGHAVRGPMHVSVQEDCGAKHLPAEIDVREHMAYVWQFERGSAEQ